jgi:bifunctional non-homologous end joining protein LigD
MALNEYKAKRDFRRTREPPAGSGRPHRKPIFVIQEHHASHLHYDFRLEAEGTLKSWAVPKPPSMDPAVKRLAVHVEDHPLGYAKFQGTIPAGQYGAGTVAIWDRGTYDNLLAAKTEPKSMADGLAAGRLEFALHGDRLRGKFAMVRMRGTGRGKENWLLIKMKDAEARPDPDAPLAKNRRGKPGGSPRRSRAAAPPADSVAFSNLDKIMYPDAGITKGAVVDFYRRIAPRLLPFLRDRPLTLERLPEGIGGTGPHFWQKHTPAGYPDWVPRVELPSEQGKTVAYALVNDVETLLYLVNQGTLTFHVWLSRLADLDRPDFVLFDLDPGGAPFADAVEVARALHDALEADGHTVYIKTSGKTGLHLLAPWATGGYDEARAWAEEIAGRVAGAMPDRATTERSKAKRGRRVYIDVMQNARGHHVVPPYVLRAVPGAPVSTPLDWREVTPDLDPAKFNLKTIFRRLARQKRDPMAGLAGA